jgi:imidazolonepropionase-like amidohydrolase
MTETRPAASRRQRLRSALLVLAGASLIAATGAASAETVLIRPAGVFTAETNATVQGWQVLVEDGVIRAVGPGLTAPAGAKVIDLPGATLTPGLMDIHSHLFLHPYNETRWDDQVIKEPGPYRLLMAVRHARDTLMAGFTTLRELGTEGVSNHDVYLKRAIDNGLVDGPRVKTATRAIVATGAYGPARREYALPDTPQGAEEASGVDQITAAVRGQAAAGADWIKLYGDYRVGPHGETLPTFTEAEMKAAVDTAHGLGRKVAVHVNSDEAMRRAVMAGADTLEHGKNGSEATFRLMAAHGVAYVPTLTATEAYGTYFQGYKPGSGKPTADLVEAERAFRLARANGVTIASGSDVGVFAHGQNGRELINMVAFGMTPAEALIAATATDAAVLGEKDHLGKVKPGLAADLAAFACDPAKDVTCVMKPVFVMKGGVVYRQP